MDLVNFSNSDFQTRNFSKSIFEFDLNALPDVFSKLFN